MEDESGDVPVFKTIVRLKRPLAQIIAVHGLGGSWDRTWTNQNGFFWLRDGLPKYCLNCNVLSADLSINLRTLSQLSVEDSAKRLIELMIEEQSHLLAAHQNVPVIFLAHAFGGLVVKKALVMIHRNAGFAPLCKAPCAVVFFGTPLHLPARPLLELSSRLNKNSSPQFLQNIGMTSELLKDLTEDFRCVSQAIPVLYFQETLATPDSKMCVGRGYATGGYHDQEVASVYADYGNLTKPSGVKDENFIQIVDSITVILKKVLPLKIKIDLAPKEMIIDETFTDPSKLRIYKMGPRYGFYRAERPESIVREEQSREWLRAALEPGGSISLDKEDFRSKDSVLWFHLPVNNTSWVRPCLRRISTLFDFDLPIIDDIHWNSNDRGCRNKTPHSRFMLPSFHVATGESSSVSAKEEDGLVQLAVYLPYLHWDTKESFGCYSDKLEALGDGRSSRKSCLPAMERLFEALKQPCGNPETYHPRRSLDQFFYSKLKNTTIRDQDQVVSRQTNSKDGSPKMLVVDQLWLWIICTGSSASDTFNCVFTCFPERFPERGSVNHADIREAVPIDSGSTDAVDMFCRIIEATITTMLEFKADESLEVFELFREAIADAAEKQTMYYRHFEDSLMKRCMVTLVEKKEEVKLVLTVADIIDELNTLKRLIETQSDTLQCIKEQLSSVQRRLGKKKTGKLKSMVQKLRRSTLPGYMSQIERMMKDAKRIQKSVLDLLDLQQKEANLAEVQSSNRQAELAADQAEETQAQSRILMLFTVVTIIFLPLSFFTSYFGMNVRQFTGESGNLSHGRVWIFMGPISFTISIALLATGWWMYTDFKTNAPYRRRKREQGEQETSGASGDPTPFPKEGEGDDRV